MSDVDDDEAAWEKLARVKEVRPQLLAAGGTRRSLTLAKLAKSPHAAVRREVAENRYVSTATLIGLSKDEDKTVRFAATQLSKLPLSRLKILSKDKDAFVRAAALSRLPGQKWFGVHLFAIIHYDRPSERASPPGKEELDTLRNLPVAHVEAMFPLSEDFLWQLTGRTV